MVDYTESYTLKVSKKELDTSRLTVNSKHTGIQSCTHDLTEETHRTFSSLWPRNDDEEPVKIKVKVDDQGALKREYWYTMPNDLWEQLCTLTGREARWAKDTVEG